MNNEVIIEILEDTLGDDELLEILMDYKRQGYTIALDDFVYTEDKLRMVKIADIIKLDFLISSYDELRSIAKSVLPYNVTLLAEKIETEEDYQLACELGCDIFQGYYFQKPTVLESSEIKTIPSVYIQLIQELNKEDVDFDTTATIIKQDTALTVAVLKLLNSAAYYSKSRVHSIKWLWYD